MAAAWAAARLAAPLTNGFIPGGAGNPGSPENGGNGKCGGGGGGGGGGTVDEEAFGGSCVNCSGLDPNSLDPGD